MSYNGKNVKVLKMTLLIRPIILLDRAGKSNTMHASQGHRPVAAPVLERRSSTSSHRKSSRARGSRSRLQGSNRRLQCPMQGAKQPIMPADASEGVRAKCMSTTNQARPSNAASSSTVAANIRRAPVIRDRQRRQTGAVFKFSGITRSRLPVRAASYRGARSCRRRFSR